MKCLCIFYEPTGDDPDVCECGHVFDEHDDTQVNNPCTVEEYA